VSIPKRSKALRAASKNFRGPSGIQHASVLGAVKDKPPLAVAAPSLTTPVRGSAGFVRGWDEGMTTAEQRNGRGALFLLQGEHSCGQLSRA
jgi:hypothetical protein